MKRIPLVPRMAFAGWVVVGALYIIGMVNSAQPQAQAAPLRLVETGTIHADISVEALADAVDALRQAGPPTDRDAKAYEDLTVAATAVGFTVAPVGVTYRWAYVTVETADIRYRYDGAAPTTTSGHLAIAGSGFWVPGPNNVSRFKAIRTAGTSAVLRATLH